MVELAEMKGQELVDVQEGGNEISLTFKNGKKYSLKVQEGRFIFNTKDDRLLRDKTEPASAPSTLINRIGHGAVQPMHSQQDKLWTNRRLKEAGINLTRHLFRVFDLKSCI